MSVMSVMSIVSKREKWGRSLTLVWFAAAQVFSFTDGADGHRFFGGGMARVPGSLFSLSPETHDFRHPLH